MNEKERRRHLRAALNRPGVLRVGKGPEVSTQVIEVSEGGLRCSFSQVVALGTAAELRFTVPVAIGKECLVVGRVQHYHRENDSFVLGIEFTRVTAEVAGTLREFVRQTEIREQQK